MVSVCILRGLASVAAPFYIYQSLLGFSVLLTHQLTE